ncbi:SHOCT domain-containing protein [Janthinobacterium sp.]|uniref:SHOCT domain-containing protein n=1 Tax=Janthinobacterium sp. TaxID=1871054 RepID=UPI0025830ED3|nr:SHOCT domain-containing protein [Janthinobacterium sp.]MCX7291897.1 SHOCT domain-containing protein [Janthinobacterium sp.]
MTLPSHPSLAGLRQRGLITAQEFDEAMDELDILALPDEDDFDMPRLAPGAGLADTLAWLLRTDLLPQDAFLQRVRDLPHQHGGAALQERQQLAAAALKLVNRQAIDTLYDENLIDQWQRDAAHASLPGDRMLASPIAALRDMLRQGTLTTQQFQTLRQRTRQHGSELARIIMEGAARQARQDRPAHARPATWVLAALMLLVLAFAGRAIVGGRATAPRAPGIEGQAVERSDLQQRAAQAVESARVPGASADLSITVVQDGAAPPAP